MRRCWFLALIGCLGCEAPLCNELDSSLIHADQAIRGSALLVNAGDETRSSFVVRLSGIPELWQPTDYYSQAGTASVSVSLSYEDPPQGNSARTQMPQLFVGLSFSGELDVRGTATPAFPGQVFPVTSRKLFQRCSELQPINCCPIGAEECEQSLRLRVERIDGTAFPPVNVDWSLMVAAFVGECPGGGAPALELSEVAQ